MKRILVDIFLFLAIFIFPWWLVVVFGVLALLAFSSFYEIVILGIVIDSLYNAAITRYHHIEFVVTIGAIFLFIVVEVLKRHLKFYGA
jgi:hypothetical protein